MIRLAPEGWPFLLAGIVLTSVMLGIAWWAGESAGIGIFWARAFLYAGGLLGVVTLFVGWFFRDPLRTPPPGEDLVLAPGDGRIIQIVRLPEAPFLTGGANRISIFLSVFNVHVQRAPLSGSVGHRSYQPGRYLAAWNPRASGENEQASLGIARGPHRVLVRQIAGLVARRVVTDPREGDEVLRGERIGLIRFGSRVDLFIPDHWEVTCREGDRARAGFTVLARIPEGGEGSR